MFWPTIENCANKAVFLLGGSQPTLVPLDGRTLAHGHAKGESHRCNISVFSLHKMLAEMNALN
jgi:hypothetical protein